MIHEITRTEQIDYFASCIFVDRFAWLAIVQTGPPFDSTTVVKQAFPIALQPMDDESKPPAPDLFEHFARTAEGIAATTKKLEKAAILGKYFATLTDDDLARAA